jgi:hypothetical protein
MYSNPNVISLHYFLLLLLFDTLQIKFSLQAGGNGRYFTVTNSEGGTYSVACSSPTSTADILRNLFATQAHAALHNGSRTPSSTELNAFSCTVLTTNDASTRAASDGDSVALSFSVRLCTPFPSAKPTDVLTAPPIYAQTNEDARDAHLVESGQAGLGKYVHGLRVGDRKLQLVLLQDLFSSGDVDPSNLSGGANAINSASRIVLVDITVLAVEAPPPAPAPAPVPAPAPSVAQSRSSRAESFIGGSIVPYDGGNGGNNNDDDIRQRSSSFSVKDRMAKLAMQSGGSGVVMMSSVGHASDVNAGITSSNTTSPQQHHSLSSSSTSSSVTAASSAAALLSATAQQSAAHIAAAAVPRPSAVSTSSLSNPGMMVSPLAQSLAGMQLGGMEEWAAWVH